MTSQLGEIHSSPFRNANRRSAAARRIDDLDPITRRNGEKEKGRKLARAAASVSHFPDFRFRRRIHSRMANMDLNGNASEKKTPRRKRWDKLVEIDAIIEIVIVIILIITIVMELINSKFDHRNYIDNKNNN